ncbi:sigma 54 modulation/S30EA ribosomal C-terminal domain-containing protein [Nocardia amamiensis]|uniref:sigma 54 modulation/S30EA ribosomal C-terminal domain-containing protein n=1 Tax=Nocardia amamiensis TaxID=404578 RepID=UPI00082A279D|nr:sigma 54 modulation/S30EA ribosomal C-terminal domain-containing protein [Nocardia amamiensis]
MSTSELESAEAASVVTVRAKGSVDSTDIARAVRSIERVMRCRGIDEPARARFTGALAIAGPVLAQVNIDGGDTPIRVQVAGPPGFIATFVADRLDRTLTRLTDAPGRRLWPDPARPQQVSVTSPRPIVRRKECELLVGDPDAATQVMDARDYDAHLFTDIETGEDAIVYWGGPLGVRLARQYRLQPPQRRTVALAMNPRPALCITEAEAAQRLCGYGLPFLFFTDPVTGRGKLLVRRYDGDLTLVAPAQSGCGSSRPRRAVP